MRVNFNSPGTNPMDVYRTGKPSNSRLQPSESRISTTQSSEGITTIRYQGGVIDKPLHSPDENTNFHFDNVTFNKDAHVTIAGKAKAVGCTFFGDLIVAGSLYLKKSTCFGSVVAGSYFSAYNSSLQGDVSVGASLYAYKCQFGKGKIFAQDVLNFMKCGAAALVEGKSVTANYTVVESFVKTTADFLVGKAFMRNFGVRKT